jgi:hypothetical protein
MKIKGIFAAIRIGLAVSKSLATGKVAKGLEKTEDALSIAEAVKALISKQNKKK